MDASQYKEGMMVRVAESIPKTENLYTANNHMHTMKGKIFKLDSLNRTGGGGYIKYGGFKYVFKLEELHALTESKPIPPVMFDPTNIDKGD